MKKNKLQKIIFSSLFTALTCVFTLVIQVPTPTKGYVNLGDCAVIISGWLLGPVYGTVAGGLGSALADFFTGYVIYAPATLIIKGLVAFTVSLLPKVLLGKKGNLLRIKWVISAVIAELVMVVGYYLYEAVIIGLGFVVAFEGVLGNVMQATVCIVIAYFVAESLSRTSICKKLNVKSFIKDKKSNE